METLLSAGSLLYNAYNNAPDLSGGIQLVSDKLYGVEQSKHLRPEPFVLICCLALLALAPEGIKPRELPDSTLIFDKNRVERLNRNGKPGQFLYASNALISVYKRTIEIALMALPPPKQEVQENLKEDSLRVIYRLAIVGLSKFKATYQKEVDEGNNEPTNTVFALQECITTIENGLKGIIPVELSSKPPIKENDIIHIRENWGNRLDIDMIADRLLRAEQNLKNNNNEMCDLQQKTIISIVLEHAYNYVNYMPRNQQHM